MKTIVIKDDTVEIIKDHLKEYDPAGIYELHFDTFIASTSDWYFIQDYVDLKTTRVLPWAIYPSYMIRRDFHLDPDFDPQKEWTNIFHDAK